MSPSVMDTDATNVEDDVVGAVHSFVVDWGCRAMGSLVDDPLPTPHALSSSDVCLICESDEWTVLRPI